MVPFKIPEILLILSKLIEFFIVFIIGIPPATAASYDKANEFILANSNNSFPWLAINALFPVTTCFLFFNAVSIIS